MKPEVLKAMYTRGYLFAVILGVCALFGVVQKWLPAAFLITALFLHWQYKNKLKEKYDNM